MDTDVNSIENARSDDATLLAFRDIGYGKGLGPGTYDIHSPVVPPVMFIEKKIQYFLEFIRTNYYLDTNQFSPGFIDKLATKSSNTTETTKALVDYLVFLKSKTNHTEQELIELNKKIEHFTKHKL